jgi:predicted TIM-barrel fold metal-dependent hydrolase
MVETTPERLISVDSHVDITSEQLRAHLPAKLQSVFDDAVKAFKAHETELRGEERKTVAQTWDHEAAGRPGLSDPYERLKDMDRDGVAAEVLYSELSAFRAFHLMSEGWNEATRAFNDCMAEFASVDPKRLLVSYQISPIDIDYAASEVLRLASIGAKSVHLPNYPHELGFPDYHDRRYDPLWAVLQETGIPISQHLGVKHSLYDVYKRDPTPQRGIFTTLPAMMLAENIGFWILTGTLERFPGLKLVFVEPGLHWVAGYLESMDKNYRGPYDYPGVKELPSTYFHRQMALTFVDDRRGVERRHDVGVENIMWSTDYPHPATTWPNSHEIVDRIMFDVPADERELMVSGNASRIYGL